MHASSDEPSLPPSDCDRCSTLTAASAQAATCESLASLALPQATITAAEAVAAGAFSQPGGRGGNPFADLPAFCRVAATLKPTADSDIKMEVWLPAPRAEGAPGNTAWNGKFLMVGNGGWNGNIDRNALAGGAAARLRRRQHRHRPRGRRRAVDGEPGEADRLRLPRGARDDREGQGARQRLLRQRAALLLLPGLLRRRTPGRSRRRRSSPRTSTASSPARPRSTPPDARSSPSTRRRRCARKKAATFPSTKYPAIHRAVLEACDAKDGVKDDVLENPRACTWDPKTIECKAGTDDASCLTPAQVVVAARALYQPVKNARTGQTDLLRSRTGERDGLEHVRQPAGVSDRHADVPADDLQEPGVGLQDAELRRRHRARGQHREGQHQRDGCQPPAVPLARREADPVPRLGRPAESRRAPAPSTTRPWSSGPAAPTR